MNLGLSFKRVQFTSDLLPSDILGFNILQNDKLTFQKGPIFTNIVLADELNRGSPKSHICTRGKRFMMVEPIICLNSSL